MGETAFVVGRKELVRDLQQPTREDYCTVRLRSNVFWAIACPVLGVLNHSEVGPEDAFIGPAVSIAQVLDSGNGYRSDSGRRRRL